MDWKKNHNRLNKCRINIAAFLVIPGHLSEDGITPQQPQHYTFSEKQTLK